MCLQSFFGSLSTAAIEVKGKRAAVRSPQCKYWCLYSLPLSPFSCLFRTPCISTLPTLLKKCHSYRIRGHFYLRRRRRRNWTYLATRLRISLRLSSFEWTTSSRTIWSLWPAGVAVLGASACTSWRHPVWLSGKKIKKCKIKHNVRTETSTCYIWPCARYGQSNTTLAEPFVRS